MSRLSVNLDLVPSGQSQVVSIPILEARKQEGAAKARAEASGFLKGGQENRSVKAGEKNPLVIDAGRRAGTAEVSGRKEGETNPLFLDAKARAARANAGDTQEEVNPLFADAKRRSIKQNPKGEEGL